MAKTDAVLRMGGAAYVPAIAGEQSPHLTTDANGYVKATSFAWFERAAGDRLRRCGLALAAGLDRVRGD